MSLLLPKNNNRFIQKHKNGFNEILLQILLQILLSRSPSILRTRTLIPIQRIHLHLSTPQLPRPLYNPRERLPTVSRLLATQILQPRILGCRLPRLNLPSTLHVHFPLKRIRRIIRILNRQRSSLRFRGFPRVDGLVDCFFNAVRYGGEAVVLLQHDGVVRLQFCCVGIVAAELRGKCGPYGAVDETC